LDRPAITRKLGQDNGARAYETQGKKAWVIDKTLDDRGKRPEREMVAR
jgi:hypothetical protein